MEGPEQSSLLRTIADLKSRDQFVPFSIVVSSGDRYRIESPENLVQMKTEFFYAHPGTDNFVFIRINQIAAVERMNEKKPLRRKAS